MPRWTKRGLVLPGYKYLGPFNDLNRGFPTNKADNAALIHDEAYAKYAKKHAWYAPYVKYNRADERFIQDTENEKDYGARIGNAFFKAKRWFAPKLQEDDFEQVIESLRSKVNTKKRLRGFPEDPPRPQKSQRPDVDKFLESTPAQTLLNLQGNQQPMGDGGGSGNAPGLRETPVDLPDGKHPITRGPADYTFATLPYYRNHTFGTAKIAADVGFRMTSPYDPNMESASNVDLNLGTGAATWSPVVASDASDPSITGARWFDFYSTMYNYYHVIGARWHMTIENLKTEAIYVHWLYINDEMPPGGATNEDIMCWNDTESHLIGPAAVAVQANGVIETREIVVNANNVEGAGPAGDNPNYETGNHLNSRGRSNIIQLSGSYKPGQKKRQIHLDSDVENWTLVTANPSLPERLLFRFKPYWNGIDTNDTNSYDRFMAVRYNFRVEYLVEFKELKYGLRWPVERQPLIALVQTNIEEDEE